MTDPLVRIVERRGNVPVVIEVKYRGLYYSYSRVAGILGANKNTMTIWTQKEYFKDRFQLPNGRFYLSEREVKRMRKDRLIDGVI